MLGQLQSDKPRSALLEDVLQIRGRVVARVDEVDVYAWPKDDLVRYGEKVVRMREFCGGGFLGEGGI